MTSPTPISIDVTAEPGQVVTLNITVSEPTPPPPPPPPPLRLGMTGLPGAEWQSYLAFYGANKIQAGRTFGKDNLYQISGAFDTDTLTEWTKWNSEKWVGADPRMLMVQSVKDDTDEYLDAWAATFPPTEELAALGFTGTVAAPWHEPEDDVRDGAFTWATFRQSGTDIATWRENHPRGKELIKYLGPILTRYDLVDLDNDPANAGFEGMNIFMFDTYQSSATTGRYWTPQEMIDAPADRIHAVYPGIDLGIPEFGYSLQTNDSTKAGWVNAHRDLVNHAKARGDVRFMIAFNSAGSMPAVPFYTSGPVAALYRDELLVAM